MQIDEVALCRKDFHLGDHLVQILHCVPESRLQKHPVTLLISLLGNHCKTHSLKSTGRKSSSLSTSLSLVFIFFGWGKGGNASCTVAPQGAVCGTPAQLASS